MKKLMTKHFSKWASKQKIPVNELLAALETKFYKVSLRQIWEEMYTKREFVLKGKAKGVVAEQFYVIKKVT